MPDYDEKAVHEEVIEYYRLTLTAHKKDPHAVETVKADEAVLAMVKETPDVLEMNRRMMEGGLSFAVARAMAVDGANFQAEVYEELDEESLAGLWRKRAETLAASKDMEELYAVSDKMDAEESPVNENEARLKQMADTVIEKMFLAEASPAGTDLDESPRQTLVPTLDELNERYPGVRFPDVLKMPRLRKRLFYTDEQLNRLAEIFEKVNAERLGGRY
jgi:hypothetical protein